VLVIPFTEILNHLAKMHDGKHRETPNGTLETANRHGWRSIDVNMDVVAYLHGFKITRPFVLLAAEMLKARR
jgi:hypothetical protein